VDAELRRVTRVRQREGDQANAAVAIGHEALLWALDVGAVRDIPGLRLHAPS
jgi:hypothetical protein